MNVQAYPAARSRALSVAFHISCTRLGQVAISSVQLCHGLTGVLDPESRIPLTGSRLGHQNSYHDPEGRSKAWVFDAGPSLADGDCVQLLQVAVADLAVRPRAPQFVPLTNLIFRSWCVQIVLRELDLARSGW